MAIEEHVIFAGNPASGKSTLLNCVIGKVVFPSGIAFGRGRTVSSKSPVIDGVRYTDTPGLRDARARKHAAEKISHAFQKGGRIKLVFVITTEAGRPQQSDIDTIQTILQAVQRNKVDVQTKYTIIVNKVPPKLLKGKNMSSRKNFEKILRESGLAGKIEYVSRLPDAEEEENYLMSDYQSSCRKIISRAPYFELKQNADVILSPKNMDHKVQLILDNVGQLRKEVLSIKQHVAVRSKKGFRDYYKRAGKSVCDSLNAGYEMLVSRLPA